MFYFGAGNVIAKTAAGAVILGTLQEIEIDFDQSIEELRGQNKLPDAIAQSALKVSGKAKVGKFDVNLIAGLLTGTAVTTGQLRLAFQEAGTVPAVTTFTITVTNSATYKEDFGVVYAGTGLPLSKVASAPAAGQYMVNETTGVYTFAAADANKAVRLSYSYTVAATGHKTVLTNSVMGEQPVFKLMLTGGYTDFDGRKNLDLTLNRCVMSKVTFPMKNTAFMVHDVEFGCFADATGEWGTLSTNE